MAGQGSTYGKIAIAADTNVQVAGIGKDIETQWRTGKVKLSFVPDATPAVLSVASTSAALTGNESYDMFVGTDSEADDFDLVAGEDLWVRATEAGTLSFRRQ